MPGLTDHDAVRYVRNLTLAGFGGVGQARLRAARVLVVGAGGLGSPAALYLAAAGVGTLGLMDDDVVELANLNRQVLHGTADLGRPKVESAVDRLRSASPDCVLETYRERLSAGNALAIVGRYDFVVDGSDGFGTKFLVNDACVLAGRPYSHAGVVRLEGQMTTVLPRRGPCYRCIFPEPPPPGSAATCQEAGILGAVAGVLGTLQAGEAIKVITGAGSPLSGQILTYDAREGSLRLVRFERDPDCPSCGERPRITGLVEECYACTPLG
ncbi:MAG: HesA/MoeB/ThiF family protein [Planctomycetes bacterium]|nr:HesA/MoeB/ThiF family protein [Planctomycetota bacterium]